MSESCVIGILNDDNTVTTMCCYNYGDFDYMSGLLIEFWSYETKLRTLLRNGSVRTVGRLLPTTDSELFSWMHTAEPDLCIADIRVNVTQPLLFQGQEAFIYTLEKFKRLRYYSYLYEPKTKRWWGYAYTGRDVLSIDLYEHISNYNVYAGYYNYVRPGIDIKAQWDVMQKRLQFWKKCQKGRVNLMTNLCNALSDSFGEKEGTYSGMILVDESTQQSVYVIYDCVRQGQSDNRKRLVTETSALRAVYKAYHILKDRQNSRRKLLGLSV